MPATTERAPQDALGTGIRMAPLEIVSNGDRRPFAVSRVTDKVAGARERTRIGDGERLAGWRHGVLLRAAGAQAV